MYVLLPRQRKPNLVLTGTSIPLYKEVHMACQERDHTERGAIDRRDYGVTVLWHSLILIAFCDILSLFPPILVSALQELR